MDSMSEARNSIRKRIEQKEQLFRYCQMAENNINNPSLEWEYNHEQIIKGLKEDVANLKKAIEKLK
jgi:hypothetical protein